ncbi:MAG: L-threonylcarbamoyladenylate synthase [Roseburia sp.]
METKILKIDAEAMEEDAINQAADIIRSGGLVAFPTETVYGLGADALSPEASRKIYAAKGRPSDNPLIVHIAKFTDLESIAKEVPPEAKTLAEAFWPGPLTMIVWKNDKVPYETTGGMDTVAIRMPDHPVALELIRRSGCLIAAPSANTSGRPSPTEAMHVAQDLGGKIPVILDGGPVGIGIESTIIDLSEEIPMILRPGYITKEMLEKALGKEVRIDPGILAQEAEAANPGGHKEGTAAGLHPKAPGMRYKHYAPKADLVLVDGAQNAVIREINVLVKEKQAQGKKVGVIATDETRNAYEADYVADIGAREDEDAIARHLYRILREFDDRDVDAIYSESFATPRIGQAIMNRLLKAAGHQVIHV